MYIHLFIYHCFTDLLGTIQMMKKSKTEVSCSSWENSHNSQSKNFHLNKDEHTIQGEGLSSSTYGSLVPSCSLPNAELICSLGQKASNKQMPATTTSKLLTKKASRKLYSHKVTTDSKVVISTEADEQVNQNTVIPSKSSQDSAKLKDRCSKLHIEHREKGTTHFHKGNVKNSLEHLSKNEISILSDLTHAASLPSEVRMSLQQFLERQMLTVANGNGKDKPKKRKANGPKFNWSLEEMQDPNKLKEVLVRVAKILQVNKKDILKNAAHRAIVMKEEAYNASMASFVELCIRTGMVRPIVFIVHFNSNLVI